MHKHSPSWFMLSSEATAHIQYNALAPAIIFTFVALCIVCLRWYSRAVSKAAGVHMEDCFVTTAMLLSIGITGAIGGGVYTCRLWPRLTRLINHEELHLDDQGNDFDEVAQAKLSTVLKLVFCQSIFYHLSINLVKASFALQYLCLFSLVRPTVYACYILLLLIVGAAAWGVLGVIFLCRPVQSYWSITASGKCINAEDHFFSTSIIGIVLDWAVWMLPMPVIGRLKLPHRQKIGLLVVFGLGGVICIVSILRLVLVHHFAHNGQVTKSGTFTLIWSSVEINVAIICASLLVMKPLFARFIPALVSEQPVSAREDARVWRGLTGLHLLERSFVDEEKQEVDWRRYAAISLGVRSARRVAIPARAQAPRGSASVRCSW